MLTYDPAPPPWGEGAGGERRPRKEKVSRPRGDGTCAIRPLGLHQSGERRPVRDVY